MQQAELWRQLWQGRWVPVLLAEDRSSNELLLRPATANDRVLTAREREVLSFAQGGAPLKQLAIALEVSQTMVSSHFREGLRKLGLRSRFELQLAASAFNRPPTARPRQHLALSSANPSVVLVLPEPAPVVPSATLTRAEIEVVQLAARGLVNAEIAAARGTRMRTIANQFQAIFRKLRVGSRSELVRLMLGQPD
jgi:DNA-binding NarL/FixJ family response regulator